MNAFEFFTYYDSLPTKNDQKKLRHRVIKECKIVISTWYSWKRKGDIPDKKSISIINKIINQ
jgi:hypothetical protein